MIRKAKPSDADKISQLIEKNNIENRQDKSTGFLRYKRSPKRVRQLIKKSIIALVFIKENKIVGFKNIYPQKKPKKKKFKWLDKKAKKAFFDKEQSATSYLTVVHPEFQHQGIGSKLTKKAIKQLKNSGYKYLFSSVILEPIKNQVSVSFIKSQGFKQVAIAKLKDKPDTIIGSYWRKIER